MKKLMIAAAIVCAATLSQAATFTWSTADDVYLPFKPANIAVGTFDAASSGSTKLIENWVASGALFTYTMLINGEESTGSLTLSDSVVAVAANNAGFVLPTDDSTKNIAWDIVINGTYNDGTDNWTITSDHITGSKGFTKNSMPQLATAVPTEWTFAKSSSPIPEPTSGLLLLLGVAGLALRRRRA